MRRRVVVTGLGTINAIGSGVEETWKNLKAGTSGVQTITGFDASELASQIAGEVKNYNPEDHFDRKEVKKLDKYTQFGIITARQAMIDAGLTDHEMDRERIGVIIGAGIGGMETFEEEAFKLFEKGPKRISPFFIPKMISNIAGAHIAIEHNLRGINFTTTSACASANHALGTALRAIQYGDADVILSGGTEAAVTRLAVAGFCSMKALSTRNDDPSTACRPFDKERDGFIMAEGAGILVLEELEHALARGAKIYAEIVGYGATCDAYHITAPAEQGEGGARAIKAALKDANVLPHEVDYMNAHGTSTPLNDKNETASYKTVFGEHAYQLKISSTKSMVGHTLGAAAAIEGMVCCLSIRDSIIHPTINRINPDPECDLDYVTEGTIEKDVNIAVSNSLGFGGHNGVLVFRKYKR